MARSSAVAIGAGDKPRRYTLKHGGAALDRATHRAAEHYFMDPDSLVPVYWPVDFLQGDAIRQVLLEEGIFCHIEGENQSGMIGVGPLGNVTRWTMKVLVRARDAERARKIIEAGDWPTYA